MGGTEEESLHLCVGFNSSKGFVSNVRYKLKTVYVNGKLNIIMNIAVFAKQPYCFICFLNSLVGVC